MFVTEELEVAAGVKQQLQSDCERYPGHRLLDGHFMLIHQALGVRQARGIVASEFLNVFIQEMKGTGFVNESLQRHGIRGATVSL